MNKKNVLLIFGGVLIVVVIVVILFYVVRKEPETAPSTPGTFPVVGGPADSTGTGIADGFFEDPLDAQDRPVEAAPRLVKITNGPVATGIIALASTADQESGASVRYIERSSGNMFEYRSEGRSITRITNKTIPGAVEAAWLADGSRAYIRYLSEPANGTRSIETYTLPTTGEGQLLARNLSQVVGDGTAVVTVSSGLAGTVVQRAGPGGVGGSIVFSSPLTKLLVFPTKGGIFAQTPASASADNYAFSLASDGLLSRIIAPTRGTTILPSPDGQRILVSSVVDGAPELSVVVIKTKETVSLPLSTFSEKCAWSPDSTRVYCGVPVTAPTGTLPDDWYQGVIGLRDRLWVIDFSNRVALFLADLTSLTETSIDAVSLAVDSKQAMLFFMNRNDGSLWAYEL